MFLYEIIVLVLIVAADIASKYAVVSALGVSNGVAERTITVIKGVLEFRYSENTGGAWSMLSDNTVLLTVFSAICSVVLIVYLFFIKKESKLLRLGIVFFAAGGLGNVYDRIVFGYVRDFISTVFMGAVSAYSVSFLVRSSTSTCFSFANAGIITYFFVLRSYVPIS